MAKDVIITPASGKVDFYGTSGGSVLANINLTDNNDLSLSTTSGNLIIGDASRDVYIGDGINEVDIVFEQNGEIRSVANKYITISAGQVNATGVAVNTSSPNAIMHVYGSTPSGTVLNVEGTNGSLFSVVDNLDGTLMSVNNNAGLPVLEVFSDDSVVAGRFGQNDFVISSGGNVGIGIGDPQYKVHVSGGSLAIESTFYAPNIGTGEDNSILILDSDGFIKTDEIDNRVWGSSLVDGSGVSNHVAFWSNGSTITYDNNQLYWNSTNNRLGIGTNSPSSSLDVVGSVATQKINIQPTGTDAGNLSSIFVGHNGDQYFNLYPGSQSPAYSGYLAFGIHSSANSSPFNVSVNNLTGYSRTQTSDIVADTGNFDIIQFNTDNGLVDTQGQIGWNDTEGTVDVALTDTAIVHIGEHTLYRIRNTTGDVLYKGQAVYASGIHSNGLIAPDLYVADGSIREIRFMGLVFEDVNNNNNGYVINFGHIYNIDTRGNVATDYAVGDETWLDGDVLYVHPTGAGKLTKVEPKHAISVAIILDAASNGKIFVRPTSYGHLDDNHDVNVSGVSDGQYLQYNAATDYWIPTSSGTFSVVNVDNLRLDGNTLSATNTNGNIIVQTSGTGALQRDSGGNSRGQYAVDWQNVRSTGTRVAGGNYSVIGGGQNNTASSVGTMVGGGYANQATNTYSVVAGGSTNTSSGYESTVGGGLYNTANGGRSVVGGGYNNTASGYNSTVGGGKGNTASSYNSTVGGGTNNIASGDYSAILGGQSNNANGYNNVFILGSNITATQANTTFVENLDVASTGDIGTLKIDNFYHQNLAVATGIADSDLMIAIVDPTGSPTTEVIQGSVLRSSLLNQPAQLQFRQGTDAERLLITPASGEPIWTTDTQKFYIGDGSTSGGDFVGPSPYDRGNGTQSIVALNNGCVASGAYSVVGGGSYNNASASHSTVGGGYHNTASGIFSTVGGGTYNNASYYGAIGGGKNNTTSGYYSTVGGGMYNNASVNFSTIGGGITNTASNYSATVSGGQSNTASANYSAIGGGKSNTATDIYTTVGGGLSNDSTNDYATIGGGNNNTASGSSSTVGGGYSNSASGNSSTIAGGHLNNAQGVYSSVMGGFTNTALGTYSTVLGGRLNQANVTHCCVVGGLGNIASGNYSTVGGGSGNSSSGSYGVALGGRDNKANGNYSCVSGGWKGKATRHGETSHAAGRFAADGDAQHTILIARRTTSDATANQVLFLDGSSARLTIPAATMWTFEVKLSAYSDTDNEAAWWIIRGGIISNDGGDVALVGSPITESGADSSLSTASASVVADDTNDALEIRVTGVAGKDIRWVAVVDISQVSYGTP